MIKGIYYLDLQEENQIPLEALQKIKHSESAFCMHTGVSSKIMGVNYFWPVLQVSGPVGRYGGKTWVVYGPFKLEKCKGRMPYTLLFSREINYCMGI